MKLRAIIISFIILTLSCQEREWNNPYDLHGDNYQENSKENIQYGSITDIDGNSYKTVLIGSQTWMAENLKVTKYRDGISVPNVSSSAAWSELATGAYCWYNNDVGYKTNFGALYTWYTIKTGKLCPTGWHVPSDSEWATLENTLGGSNIAGGKMKSISGWNSPNTGATNSSGFSGLPGGYRGFNSLFYSIGNGGNWWSSTEYSPAIAWSWYLTAGTENLEKFHDSEKMGFSVRCIKD